LEKKHEWKSRKTPNPVGRALDAKLRIQRLNHFKQYLNEQKHQAIRNNSFGLSRKQYQGSQMISLRKRNDAPSQHEQLSGPSRTRDL